MIKVYSLKQIHLDKYRTNKKTVNIKYIYMTPLHIEYRQRHK